MLTILLTILLYIYLPCLLAILLHSELDIGLDEWLMFILSPVLFVCLLYTILSSIFTGDWEELHEMERMRDGENTFLFLLLLLYFYIVPLLFIMYLITANFVSL